MTPRDLWPRFRALPAVWQVGAALVVVAGLLWLAGGIGRAWSGLRDWYTDRELIELQQKYDAALLDNAKLEGQLQATREQRALVEAGLELIAQERATLAERGAEQDERITTARKRTDAVRRAPLRTTPVPDAEWDRILREYERSRSGAPAE